MQITAFFTTLAAVASVVAAGPIEARDSDWHIRLYRFAGFDGKIVDEHGDASTGCRDLRGSKNDAVSSIKWDSGRRDCNIILYHDYNCEDIIFSTRKDYENSRLSGGKNNEISSWKVNCRR